MAELRNRIRTIVAVESARERECVKRTLRREPDFETVGEADGGNAAVDLVRSKRPDLVFLGAHMEDLDGFGVLDALGMPGRPSVVFLSRFEDDAVRAFEYRATDFVLTPCSPERLSDALTKVRDVFALMTSAAAIDSPASAIHASRGNPSQYLDRLVIKSRDRIYFLRLADVDWIEAAGDYVHVYAFRKRHILRAKIGDLETRLDPGIFVRIHRSTIVHIDRIAELRPLYHGDYQVVLSDKTELTLSRGYKGRFSQFLLNTM